METVSCCLCQSERSTLLFESPDYTVRSDRSYRVVRCDGCGLVYLNPRPTLEEIARCYPEDYASYQFEIATAPRASWKDRFISRITESMNVQRVKSISRALELSSRTRALDVGCGKGGFLYTLRKMHGCGVQGLDFSDDCIDYCRDRLQVPVLRGDIRHNEEALRGRSFDLITFWAYLEHDFTPLPTLVSAREHLADDGLLVVEVPNVDSLENRIFGSRSFLYDIPRHLYDFSPRTLELLLDKAGFRIVKTSFPLGVGGYLGTLQHLLTGGRVYRSLRDHVGFLMAFGGLVYLIEFLLSAGSLGSTLRVFAVKKR